MNKMVPLLFAFITIFILSACAQTPSHRVATICSSCQPQTLNQYKQHPLPSYSNNLHIDSNTLHIYLEGDGLPWSPKGYPNKNPSSKQLTALQLMSLDSGPSFYINRPCYGYTTTPESCTVNLWTSGRYSNVVIQAINSAIDEIQEKHYFEKIILIGHSGGGTIAMLLANRRKDIAGVITLGANLDHQNWTTYFGSPALVDSLNPSTEPPLDVKIVRWHFSGDKDTAVPAELTKKAADKDPYAQFFLEKNYDHNCCWKESWPMILQKLDSNHFTKHNSNSSRQKK